MAITALVGNSIFSNIPQMPNCAALITPHDTDTFEHPVHVRANAAGAVTFAPAGNGTAEQPADVTMTLAAGEVIPCMVRAVRDTGTDAIVLHALY